MTSLVESLSRSSRFNILTGCQIPGHHAWLSPADPSTNHNISRKAHNEGTAVWFFQGKIFIEWKSTGCLLWIHGKRASLSAFIRRAPSDCDAVTAMLLAGSGKSLIWFVYPSWLPIGTYSSPVPQLLSTLRPYAKLDRPSWPTFTSIPRIPINKPVTISCALSYFSFSLALVLAVASSTTFKRHTMMVLSSRVTTL
jgi:hypothetical protein